MSSSVQHQRLTSHDDLQTSDDESYGCCGYVLMALAFMLLVVTFPFSLFISLKVVQEYQRAVIFRLGRIKAKRAQGPGLFFVLPCVDTFVTVDLRTFTFNVPPQEILTKDSVTVMVDAVIYARIFDPTMSTIKVNNARASTYLLGATTLRTVMGTVGLAELLSDRERIDHVMQTNLDSVTHNWGIKVERVEIKDVRIPVQMQRAMAAEAESSREAKAKVTLYEDYFEIRKRKEYVRYMCYACSVVPLMAALQLLWLQVIAADGELRASRSLKEAADVMMSSPMSLQLRYLQTLQTVAEENNHTIMFPIPTKLMSALSGGISNIMGSGSETKGAAQQPLLGDLMGDPAADTQF